MWLGLLWHIPGSSWRRRWNTFLSSLYIYVKGLACLKHEMPKWRNSSLCTDVPTQWGRLYTGYEIAKWLKLFRNSTYFSFTGFPSYYSLGTALGGVVTRILNSTLGYIHYVYYRGVWGGGLRIFRGIVKFFGGKGGDSKICKGRKLGDASFFRCHWKIKCPYL